MIEAHIQAWETATNRHDLEATLAFYTDNLVRRALGHPLVSSRENMARHWRRNFSREDFTIRFKTERTVFLEGHESAYEYGI